MVMGEGSFHFNVNNRDSGGSKAKMANNEDSFLRAMEILERRREKEELENPTPEEVVETPVEEEPVIEETIQEEEVEATAEETTVNEEETPPPTPQPTQTAPTKPSGGGVPGPTPRRDFTSEERAAMLKRAKAHAAEVEARKNK